MPNKSDDILKKYGVTRVGGTSASSGSVDILKKYGVERSTPQTTIAKDTIVPTTAPKAADTGKEDDRNIFEKLADFFGYTGQKAVSGALEGTEGVVNTGSYYQQLAQKSAMQQAAGGAAMAAAFSKDPNVKALAEKRQEEAQESAVTPMKTVANFGDRYAQKVEEKYADKPLSGATRIIGGAAEGLGGLLPSAVANLIVPGSGLAVMTTGAIGNAVQEQKKAGVDDNRAIAYGITVGAIEALTEKMLGGMGGLFGKGALDDVAKNLIKSNVNNGAVAAGMNTLVSFFGEGLEEFVSEYAQALANRGIVGTDNRNFGEVSKDALRSALIGGIVGSIANIGDSIRTGKSVTPKQAAIEAAENTAKTVENAMPAQGEISRSDGVSSQPATDASEDAGAVRGMPGLATDEAVQEAPQSPYTASVFTDRSVGAAQSATGEQVPSQFSLPESEWGTQEMRDAIEQQYHERVDRALRHARAQGKLLTDESGNLLYVEETADDLLSAENWDRVEQTLATSYLAPELFKRGDMTRYSELVNRIAQNRSKAGGMLQEAQDYPRTPDGKVVQAVQAVNAANKEKLEKAAKNRTNVGGTAKAAKTIVESEVDAAANVASEEAEKSRRVGKRRSSRFTEFNPDGTFKVGTKVRAKDRGNIGTIVSYDPASDTYMVRFKSKDGLTSTIPMRSDMLEAITAGEPANDERTVGERLAQRLLKQSEDNYNTPIGEQAMLKTLVKYANDNGAPKGSKRVSETAADRLVHYFSNRDAYNKAWQQMQAIINEKGFSEQNPELLHAFNSILTTSGASIDGMHTGEIIRAILEGSKDLGVSKASIQNYATLGAEEAVVKKLADDLISKTGATDVDAIGIEFAVRDYVKNIAAKDKASDRLGGIVGAATKASGVKLSDMIKQNWTNKAQALEAITDYVVREYGLDGEDAEAAAKTISDRFYKELSERSRKALEQRFKPRGKARSKTSYEKFAELLINLDAISDDVYRDLAMQSIYGEDISLTESEIRQIHSLMEQSISVRESDAQLADIMEASANKIIASKMPKSFKAQLTTLLYNSMLGNLKTLIARNAGGNVFLAAAEQVPTKVFSAAADAALGKITGERYRAMPGIEYYKEYGKGFAKGVKDFASDFASDVHTPRSGESATVEMQYEPFKAEYLNEINKLVRSGLELGDRPFYEAQYAARMSELNKLKSGRKLSEEQLAEFDEWAPVVARMDALAAVFQTKNTKDNPDAAHTAEGLRKLKEGVNGIVQGITGIDVAGQAALPFTSTPGNMLETTADYIPVLGLAKNAVQSAREIKEGRFDQNRASLQLGRQATGALLAGAASALFQSGMISGGGNEQDKELLEQSGWQEYSVKIGDSWYGYDWIPILGPIMAGTADYVEARKYGDQSILDAIGTAAGTVTSMSALQGLNRLFGGYENTVEGFADAVMGLPSQAIPSAVRQFAKTADEYERATYDPNAVISELKYIASGIPFLRDNLPEAVDMFGNPVKAGDGRGYAARAAENFLSPGWVSEEQDNPLTSELLRLAGTGNTVGISSISKTYKDASGRTVKMTAEQYHNYQVTRGSKMAEIMEAIMDSPAYKGLTDSQKSEAMSYAVDIANATAKDELYKSAGIKSENEYKKVLDLGEKAGDYVLFKEAYGEVYSSYENEEPVSEDEAHALDAIMKNASSLDKAVIDMLDDVSGFSGLRKASEKGVNTKQYFGAKSAIRDAKVPAGYSNVPDWKKFQTVAALNFGDGAALGLIESINETAGKKFRAAYDEGVPLDEIVAYYEAISSRKSDGTEKKSADKKRAIRETEFSSTRNRAILNRIF